MAPASEGLCLPGIFLIRVLEAYSTAPAKQARGRMGGSGLGGLCAGPGWVASLLKKHWCGEEGSGPQDRVCLLFQEEQSRGISVSHECHTLVSLGALRCQCLKNISK